MKSLIRRVFLFSTLAILLYSCTDDYFEFDKITTEEWRPEFAFPVINSTLTLEDIIIKEDSGEIIQTDPNTGILEVVYDGSVFSKVGGQFIDLPSQTFNSGFPVGIPSGSSSTSLSQTINLTFNTSIEIDTLKLKAGDLIFTLESSLQHPMDIELDFRGIKNAMGQSLKLNYQLPPATGGNLAVRSEIADLSGYIVDMKGGSNNFNNIAVDVSGTINRNNASSNNNGQLDIIGSLRNLEFKEFTGYIGQQNLDLDIDTIGINLFRNFKTGTFFVSNPTLEIDIKNSYALPAYLSFQKLDALNIDKTPNSLSINLPTDPQTNSSTLRSLESPLRYGVEVTDLDLNNANSNIDNVISFLLKEIVYDSEAQFNPNGKTAQRNFLTDTSGIGLDVFLKIPFEGRASKFLLVDTIDFDFELAADIEDGNVRVISDNGFPVDVKLQVVFADSTYVGIDSLYDQGAQSTVPSAPVNANGDAVGSTRAITDAFVDKRRFSRLSKTSYAILKAELNTKDATSTPPQNVRFRGGYTLQISVGLKAAILID